MAEATKIVYTAYAGGNVITQSEVSRSYNPPRRACEFRGDTWDSAFVFLYGEAEKRVGKAREELAAAMNHFQEVQNLQKSAVE
jgi:hypothetical protein